ncbi:glycerol kinase GlpK [Bordetella avium]|uniref:Glycerol kinase n=1 Tax=Bordetella avium (strain 197N) TaxID=360910 RepID=Q2KUJ8_BORA1|nr:glycerol kinase GlpK [Bordetella avium]AZY50392.1 glycerol kinase [Bordetella avium]AZY53788.1 glycerol kinase [Bordetella avium]RIQ15439.1 glycerol kinase [Bordetella avium]RIQ19755.1 glycerol kinase [Bordetella avium]RIQ34335.1 glycerol kinase [Bordetella avium]
MTNKYVLALDQGTTSSRAIVFDRKGAVRGVGQREFSQHYPRPGWVEHDATEIWTTQLEVSREALRNAGASAADIAAIGITNQRETTLLWERATGRPLARAIVWQDRRTAPMCEQLHRDGHAPWLQSRTGLVVDAYFSGTKLAWLLDHVPGAREAAERGELAFGTMDTWLVWQLTGGAVHSTDPSNASRTMLFDLHTQDWNEDILALLNIPRSVLPQIAPSSAVIGHAQAEWLGGAIPIAGVAGDQQAATFGQACFRPGMAKNTYGTGCFMLMNVGDAPVASRNNLLSTVGWSLPSGPAFMLEGGVFVAGAAVQWLRDGLGIIQHAEDIEALAASVADSDDVFMVPAFAGLGAPHWDPYARGTLVGMTRGTTRAHIARATLESIALQSAELLDCMNADSGIALSELRVDGGASRNDLLMQMQADVLGVPVVRPRVAESTARGAAGLAGLAVGFWSHQQEFASQWEAERSFEPRWTDDVRQARMQRWKQAVELSKHWSQPA